MRKNMRRIVIYLTPIVALLNVLLGIVFKDKLIINFIWISITLLSGWSAYEQLKLDRRIK